MNLKSITLLKRVASIGVAAAFAWAPLHAQITFDQVILTDDFNDGTDGESLFGENTSDGNTFWDGGGPGGADLTYQEIDPGENVFRAFNDDGQFGVVWTNAGEPGMNANDYVNYQVEFGNVTLVDGAGIGYVMLSGRKSFSDLAGGYRFMKSGGDWLVQFQLNQGDGWDSVGTIEGESPSLDNLQLRVLGEEQALFQDGVALFPDDGFRPTQGSLTDESNTLIEVLANSAPSESEFAEATLNNMTVAVPEPSTYALIFGGAVLGLVVLRRRWQR